MLTQILDALQAAQAPLSLAVLSQQLAVQPETLEGMLLTLIRKGRIVEMCRTTGAPYCANCPIATTCSTTHNKIYVLVDAADTKNG